MAENTIVETYLNLLDSQRRTMFKAVEGLDVQNLWRRPINEEWCIGEVLDHTRAVNASFLSILRLFWLLGKVIARTQRHKPYNTQIDDVYQRANFPLSVGWLWPPKYSPENPAPLSVIKRSLSVKHERLHTFFKTKDPDLLGHVWLFDPLVGRINLIQSLRVSIYHDQLHYQDVIKLAEELKHHTTPVA